MSNLSYEEPLSEIANGRFRGARSQISTTAFGLDLPAPEKPPSF